MKEVKSGEKKEVSEIAGWQWAGFFLFLCT